MGIYSDHDYDRRPDCLGNPRSDTCRLFNPFAMLPQDYQDRYQTLSQSLQTLQNQVTQANPDPMKLRSQFLEAQQWFQQKIIGLDVDDQLEPADESTVRSYNTEINKHLRLLGMDLTFLQAAKQPTTAQQRQAQIRDRIQTLLAFCQNILNPTDASS